MTGSFSLETKLRFACVLIFALIFAFVYFDNVKVGVCTASESQLDISLITEHERRFGTLGLDNLPCGLIDFCLALKGYEIILP